MCYWFLFFKQMLEFLSFSNICFQFFLSSKRLKLVRRKVMDDMLSTNEEQSFGWRSICHPTSILQVGHLLETDSLHFPSRCFGPMFRVSKVLVAQSCLILWDPLDPGRLLCPWNSPGKNTGVGCHCFFQGIFPTQGSNSHLPHWRHILYHMRHQGRPG